MRTLSTGLTTHVAQPATTLARMLRLDLVDGTTLALTDHNKALSFDLGDGSASYLPDTGIIPSDLALSVGFTVDDMEIEGPINDTVTRTAVLGGRFDDAVVRLFVVNWRDLSLGAAKLLKGYVVQAAVEGDRFKLTVHSETTKFAQTIGRVISAYCDADFGDTRCGYTVTPLSATVSAVTSEREFTVTFTGSYANDYFNRGTVLFTSGTLSGTRKVEIDDWTSGGLIKLFAPLVELPTIGDTLEIRQGCAKTRAACLAFNNVVNFRGFPDVPGSDQVLKYPNPQ